MKKDNNAEKHNLPSENEKKNNGLTEKVKSIVQNASERRLEKNVVFSEPLTPAERPDETAPLRKGGIDMWFLLWSMILVCLGAVMSYSASAVYAEREYGSSTHYLWRYILFAIIACVVTVLFVV